jgi:septum formation protein
MAQLILASGSPRRQAFLVGLGLDFQVETADVDEAARPGELPAELVLRLSRAKAQAVALRHAGGATILAADTVVVLDGRILGKPADAGAAARMLHALAGRMHQVFTAVSLAWPGSALLTMQFASRLCESRVWMRSYGDAEVAAYVATGDPLDKAGAYAIQHPVFAPVARWEGCYASIMGLPLGLAAQLLQSAGIFVPADVSLVCEGASGTANCCQRGPAGGGCRAPFGRVY